MAKIIKDPIYGYIELPNFQINQIIDTPVFQRLRDITQTSYKPLYPSATHTRFTHSIGVYYLGHLAVNSLVQSLLENFPDCREKISDLQSVFELACLLHDVGHAPFSHTTEKFFLKNGEKAELNKKLADITGDTNLVYEIARNGYKAASHELMSAIIGIKEFKNAIGSDLSFFARCITGFKYSPSKDGQKISKEQNIKNCFIELLNSKVIDVDKLDYLIRDAYVTGYDSVNIDYKRLLNSICFMEDSEEYKVCYNKNAVSVLENVVYARDSEKKWIQNHPSVLYEIYLLENITAEVLTVKLKSDIFLENYLSEKGLKTTSGIVRLMGDSDLCFLMKNLADSNFVNEYYDRNLRKKPVWKSEAEFHAIFKEKKIIDKIIETFFLLQKSLKTLNSNFVVNASVIDSVESDVKQIEEEMADLPVSETGRRERLQDLLDERKTEINWLKILFDFAKDNAGGKQPELLILFAEPFISGFSNEDFSNLSVIFPEAKTPFKFSDVSNVLSSGKMFENKFFYIYFNRDISKTEVSIKNLYKNLATAARELIQKEEQEKTAKTAENLI